MIPFTYHTYEKMKTTLFYWNLSNTENTIIAGVFIISNVR